MDNEEEREEYFARAQGVAQDAFGQFWRYSGYARGEIPAWHPAMLGRRRGSVRTTRQDVVNAVLFVAIVFGTIGVAFLAPSRYKVAGSLAYLGAIGAWVVIAEAARRGRRASQGPRRFPHPGPKGHHRHR